MYNAFSLKCQTLPKLETGFGREITREKKENENRKGTCPKASFTS